MAILFQNQDIDFKLPNVTARRSWIKFVVEFEKRKTGEISFVFMNDRSLLDKNIQFLNHNTLTDIITFDYNAGKIVNGDILISIERVKENALKFDVDFEQELNRVMIHGILHLCGYKDKNKKDKDLMRKKEDWALKKFNSARPGSE